MRILIKGLWIVILAGAVAVAGLLLLPGERIARIAAEQLSKLTGREVTISPETSISFYPVLGVTTDGARIGAPDWAQAGPLFETNKLAIGIDVPALLTGQIKIQRLFASNPKITLERATDGRGSWDLFPEQASAPPAGNEAARSLSDYDISLDRALIENATLRYVDHAAGTEQSFETVDLDLRWPDKSGPAEVRLDVTPFDAPITLAATIADVPGLLDGKTTALIGTVESLGNRFGVKGAAGLDQQAALHLEGDFPDVAGLLRAAGQRPAALGLSEDFKASAQMQSDVTFNGTLLTLRNLAARLNESQLSGSADVTLTQTQPDITAQLTLDLRELGTLMRLAGRAPEQFGLGAGFNPDLTGDLALSSRGSDLDAHLTGLTAKLEQTQARGEARVTLKDGAPDIVSDLKLTVPNAARTAALLGQPLTGFGLPASTAPSVTTGLKARLQGSTLNADLSALTAQLGDARLSGDAKLKLAGGTPALSGTLSANIPNTDQMMRALGQSALSLPKGIGRSISARSQLSFTPSRIKLNDLRLTADQNSLAGSVDLDLSAKVPRINATLQAGDLDLKALTGGTSQSTPKPAGSGWSTAQIDASALGALNGTIALRANSIDLGTLQLGQSDLALNIDRARGVLTINDMRAYRGRLKGQVVANNRNGLSVGGDLSATNVSLKDLFGALAGIDAVDAAARVRLTYLGIGNSLDAIMKSLSGTLALDIPEGTVAGVDLEGLIMQGDANNKLTPFRNLRATGAIKGGVLRNSDLTTVTGRVDAKGEGYINLGGQSMDYLVTPIVKDAHSSDTLALPVRIKGPWSDLKFRPDLEAALNLKAEREKLEQMARDELEREKHKLREQAEAEARKLEEKARAEARKLEEQARKRLEDEARKAAQKAAKQLGLEREQQRALEDAAKKALGNELEKGLRGLFGNN